MAYRIVKWGMAAAAALYLALVLLLPAAAGLRRDVFAWFLYGAYVLVTVMVWGLGGNSKRNISAGMTKEETDRSIEANKEKARLSRNSQIDLLGLFR